VGRKIRTSNGRRSSDYGSSEILLEQFSIVDLKEWSRKSKDFSHFHYEFYYQLEAQRATRHKDLVSAVRRNFRTNFEFNNWSRVVDFMYVLEPLSSLGSLLWLGGRFNFGKRLDPSRFPPFPAFYIGSDLETALREKFGVPVTTGSTGLSREELANFQKDSFSSVSLSGRLQSIFDLTDKRNLKEFVEIIQDFKIPRELRTLARKLGIKSVSVIKTQKKLLDSLLMSDWRRIPAVFDIPANSQIFGKLLLDAGIEGVLFPSSKGLGICVAIFPQNLDGSSSFVELDGPCPEEVSIKRLDGSTWQELV